MKKLLLLLPFLVLFGCEEKDNRTKCQRENIGYIAFKNDTDDAYDIWIDNKHYKQQPANSYTTYFQEFSAGKVYYVKAVQVSGYVFKPSVYNYKITLNQCDEKWVIIE